MCEYVHVTKCSLCVGGEGNYEKFGCLCVYMLCMYVCVCMCVRVMRTEKKCDLICLDLCVHVCSVCMCVSVRVCACVGRMCNMNTHI